MVKKIFRLEIVRDYESRDEAVRAARKAVLPGRHVAVFEESVTESGQRFHREPVWDSREKKCEHCQ